MAKKLDFSFIGKMSDVSSDMSKLKKHLWENERKVHKKCKEQMQSITRMRERTSHFVMSGNELYVARGQKLLEEMRTTLKIIKETAAFDARDQAYICEEINRLMEEIDALEVLIDMSEHQNSYWDSLK